MRPSGNAKAENIDKFSASYVHSKLSQAGYYLKTTDVHDWYLMDNWLLFDESILYHSTIVVPVVKAWWESSAVYPDRKISILDVLRAGEYFSAEERLRLFAAGLTTEVIVNAGINGMDTALLESVLS